MTDQQTFDDFNFVKVFDAFLQKQRKCRNFENNQDIKKLPRQIYNILLNVPCKSFNS